MPFALLFAAVVFVGSPATLIVAVILVFVQQRIIDRRANREANLAWHQNYWNALIQDQSERWLRVSRFGSGYSQDAIQAEKAKLDHLYSTFPTG